jgi:hypothetical protein
MKKLIIEIELENRAFEDGLCHELSTIFDDMLFQIGDAEGKAAKLRDSNGIQCGAWKITK